MAALCVVVLVVGPTHRPSPDQEDTSREPPTGRRLRSDWFLRVRRRRSRTAFVSRDSSDSRSSRYRGSTSIQDLASIPDLRGWREPRRRLTWLGSRHRAAARPRRSASDANRCAVGRTFWDGSGHEAVRATAPHRPQSQFSPGAQTLGGGANGKSGRRKPGSPTSCQVAERLVCYREGYRQMGERCAIPRPTWSRTLAQSRDVHRYSSVMVVPSLRGAGLGRLAGRCPPTFRLRDHWSLQSISDRRLLARGPQPASEQRLPRELVGCGHPLPALSSSDDVASSVLRVAKCQRACTRCEIPQQAARYSYGPYLRPRPSVSSSRPTRRLADRSRSYDGVPLGALRFPLAIKVKAWAGIPGRPPVVRGALLSAFLSSGHRGSI